MRRPNHRPPGALDSFPVAEPIAPPPAGAPGEGAAPAEEERRRAAPAIAQLRFLGPQSAVVPLEHPFEWEGLEIHEIVPRRLAVAEVGAVMQLYGDDDPIEIWDFVAAMTGLPAPVLRGLAGDDGAEVLARARPFLPRFVQGLLPLAIEPARTSPTTTSSGTGAEPPSQPSGP